MDIWVMSILIDGKVKLKFLKYVKNSNKFSENGVEWVGEEG